MNIHTQASGFFSQQRKISWSWPPHFLKGRKLTVKSIFHVYEDICNWYSMTPPPPSPGLRFSWFWEIAFLFGLSRYFGWLCSNRIFIRACYAKRWDKFYFKRPNSNSIRTYLGSSSCRLSQKIHRHSFFSSFYRTYAVLGPHKKVYS